MKKMRVTLFFLLAATAIFVPTTIALTKVGEPDLVIKGKVVDSITGRPIAGAKVGDTERYNSGKFCTVTDSNGYYEYKTWQEEHDIAAEADGYKKMQKGCSGSILQNEKEKIFDFALEPEKGKATEGTEIKKEESTPTQIIPATGEIERPYLKNVKFKITDEHTGEPIANRELGICRFVNFKRMINSSSPYLNKSADFYITSVITDGNGVFTLDLSLFEGGQFIVEPNRPYMTADFERSCDLSHTQSEECIRIFEGNGNKIYNLKEKTVKNIPFTGETKERPYEFIQLFTKRMQTVPVVGIEETNLNRTPLHLAAMNGHREMAEMLLSKGSDINAKDSDGNTPLHFAAAGGHLDLCGFLLEKGADVNAKNRQGQTPLDMSAFNGHQETAELLIAKGAVISPAGQDANGAGKIDNVDLSVEDFDINPYEAGGLYTVTAKIGNKGLNTSPDFPVYFYQSGPLKAKIMRHNSGPIKAGEIWSEGSMPFAITEGINKIEVVLDPNNIVAEKDETNNQAMLTIKVKDGKIVEKRFIQSIAFTKNTDGSITAIGSGNVTINKKSCGPDDLSRFDKTAFDQLLSKNVTVDIDKSPDGSGLTVQYAVIAVCKAAGVPYNREKSAQQADPQRRSFIEPLHIKDKMASEAIADILKPFSLNYTIDSDGLFIYKIQNRSEILKKDYIPETSTVDANGRIVDKIDYPFDDDTQVVGRWVSVDFVRDINSFQAGSQQWSGELHLKELEMLPGGKMGRVWAGVWTKGLIIDPESKTASKYIIKHIGDSDYMFFEWKSGDYFIRGRKPAYYVLQKDSAGIELPIELKAFDEWSMNTFKQYLDVSENSDSEDMCLRELKAGKGDDVYWGIAISR
ncbi:MAG: ankyrin repeat domain-containing protein [Sedimentisphaerales bacterium]